MPYDPLRRPILTDPQGESSRLRGKARGVFEFVHVWFLATLKLGTVSNTDQSRANWGLAPRSRRCLSPFWLTTHNSRTLHPSHSSPAQIGDWLRRPRGACPHFGQPPTIPELFIRHTQAPLKLGTGSDGREVPVPILANHPSTSTDPALMISVKICRIRINAKVEIVWRRSVCSRFYSAQPRHPRQVGHHGCHQ